MASPRQDGGSGAPPSPPLGAFGDGSVAEPPSVRVGAPAPPVAGPESTVGTGSAVAIGCTVASVLVILLGVGILVLVRLL